MNIRCLALLGASLAVLPLPSQAGAHTLSEVTELALANSPAIAAAEARADAADAQVDYAKAQRLPDLTAQGQIGVGRLDPKGYFNLYGENVTPRAASVSAQIPLYTFGRIGGGIDQAKGGSKAAALMAQQARLNLRVEVADAYSQAVAAKRLINSYDLLRLQLAEMLRQTKLKFDVGDATSTEIAQAQARLAEADAGLAGAKGNLATAMAQLRSLSGTDITLDDTLPAAPLVPGTREEAMGMALQSNPQLLAAQQMVQVAQGKERSAKAESLPTVGAFAEASSVRDQFFPNYVGDSWTVGVQAQWNFFSFGRNEAKSRAAGSEVDAAEADLANARLRTEQAAITAFENHATAKLMVQAADARNKAAKEALRGTKLEVEAGAKPQLSLLDAQREAIEAEAAHARAQGQLIASAYMLRAVTGME